MSFDPFDPSKNLIDHLIFQQIVNEQESPPPNPWDYEEDKDLFAYGLKDDLEFDGILDDDLDF